MAVVFDMLGPVVRKSISTNQGLNFNPGFYFYCSKTFSPIISCIVYRASNHQIVDKIISLNFIFKLPYLNSNFALTLGSLNLALNNPVLFGYGLLFKFNRWKGKPARYMVEFKKNRFTIGNDYQFNTLSDLVEVWND